MAEQTYPQPPAHLAVRSTEEWIDVLRDVAVDFGKQSLIEALPWTGVITTANGSDEVGPVDADAAQTLLSQASMWYGVAAENHQATVLALQTLYDFETLEEAVDFCKVDVPDQSKDDPTQEDWTPDE